MMKSRYGVKVLKFLNGTRIGGTFTRYYVPFNHHLIPKQIYINHCI